MTFVSTYMSVGADDQNTIDAPLSAARALQSFCEDATQTERNLIDHILKGGQCLHWFGDAIGSLSHLPAGEKKTVC